MAAGLVEDIDELPRFFTAGRADAIAKYLKTLNDWSSSREIADHLATLPEFRHLNDTHVRTCSYWPA